MKKYQIKFFKEKIQKKNLGKKNFLHVFIKKNQKNFFEQRFKKNSKKNLK